MSTRGWPDVPSARISTVWWPLDIVDRVKTINRAAESERCVSTVPDRFPSIQTSARPRTGLTAATHAKPVPVNLNRAMPPVDRVEREPWPSYEPEVVRLQVPRTNVSERVVSWETVSLKVPAGVHAPTLPATSTARTWNW